MDHRFQTDNPRLQKKYDEAFEGLQKNTMPLFGHDEPVLIEGGAYQGIWLECGPLESAVYGRFYPEIAAASHRIFFRHQREDGVFRAVIARDFACEPKQVNSVVPIAATAYETAQMTQDESFLQEAYDACVRFDGWISRNRDTRGTGLCELFCVYDTGQDNSPRFRIAPNDCPGKDAGNCPPLPWLPG
jgi:hypothetical protein